MGMPYPGGVHLDKIAEAGDETAFSLPHPKVSGSPYDFSFSGLKTAVINLLHNAKQKGETISVEDLSASFRRAVVDCLTKNVVRAMEDRKMTKLVIAGGVSANRLVRREFDRICKERGWFLFVPELSLCGDNAAMVGAQGYYEFLSGKRAGMELNACAAMTIE